MCCSVYCSVYRDVWCSVLQRHVNLVFFADIVTAAEVCCSALQCVLQCVVQCVVQRVLQRVLQCVAATRHPHFLYYTSPERDDV